MPGRCHWEENSSNGEPKLKRPSPYNQLCFLLEAKFTGSPTLENRTLGSALLELPNQETERRSRPILASGHEDGFIYLWTITVGPFA